jgi:hypothetical protein
MLSIAIAGSDSAKLVEASFCSLEQSLDGPLADRSALCGGGGAMRAWSSEPPWQSSRLQTLPSALRARMSVVRFTPSCVLTALVPSASAAHTVVRR